MKNLRTQRGVTRRDGNDRREPCEFGGSSE